MLTLQIGLIDQGQLVAAFQAWTRAGDRPLAEHLAARGDLDAEQRAGVEAIVALHLKKFKGDAEQSLAAVTAGPSDPREPGSAGRYRDRRARLSLLGWNPRWLVRIPTARSPTQWDRSPSDGQRFRILRQHAQGGLGAVFVALDTELHREVAVKQILDQHVDDSISRARFLLEAEVTGGLEHPGIVPVYALGSDAGGRPYYAMRFIRGDSLKDTIDRFHADGQLKADSGRRSLELRKLLHRFIDVCNAIDYAHNRGILHRDIKPSNIIIGEYGETLVVDWGLAKPLGQDEPRRAIGRTAADAFGSGRVDADVTGLGDGYAGLHEP